MERRTISKGEIICSCRRQNRDNICAVFAGVYALGNVMGYHTISKDEKEHRFLKIKENKICIFNPIGECSFHGVLLFMTIESMRDLYARTSRSCSRK